MSELSPREQELVRRFRAGTYHGERETMIALLIQGEEQAAFGYFLRMMESALQNRLSYDDLLAVSREFCLNFPKDTLFYGKTWKIFLPKENIIVEVRFIYPARDVIRARVDLSWASTVQRTRWRNYFPDDMISEAQLKVFQSFVMGASSLSTE